MTGDQHPLLTVIADHSVALLAVIRAIIDDMDRSAPPPSRRAARWRRNRGGRRVGAESLPAHPGHRRGIAVARC
ncbi:hypothetical protein I552_0244 [Mycobacterium xenopi 3993]|nr:hypothetical protein I552_0244 [Mycobacterium xenopi 3993]